MDSNIIRNFCIIAHIDHGKSTLADRLLEKTGTLSRYEMKDQVLDNMQLERERGITIKSHAIRMEYRSVSGKVYEYNLIDTPGHVDFTYEVSRSLAACEGALLVVDATQGIEAQTLSNLFLAMDNDLTIIPLINKIDLPSSRVDEVRKDIVDLLGCEPEEVLAVSAKEGIGIDAVLEAVAARIPAPKGNPDAPLRALVFDSVFDPYRGAVAYVRIVDGVLRKGMKIRFHATGLDYQADEMGSLRLVREPKDTLHTGEVGYLIANIKRLSEIKVGDTIVDPQNPAQEVLRGFKEIKPMVFSGLYPADSDDYEDLKNALEKLRLNDSAISYEPESSVALGFGYRAGFLGILHMEVVQERLEREFNVRIINTVPNVEYKIIKTGGETIFIENPAAMPSPGEIERIEEPIIKSEVLVPSDFVGAVMKLGEEKRGIMKNMEYLTTTRVCLHYEFPLAEVIFDFFDKLKSVTKGYASFDYDFLEYRESDLVKLDILINGDGVDAFSTIIHNSRAYEWGRALCNELKEKIPRQLFEVAVQAAIGNKVIARTTIKPLRKNVTAKCYGGDITRKRKLLEKQKEGKKRMKQVGNVEIPQEAFLAVLSMKV